MFKNMTYKLSVCKNWTIRREKVLNCQKKFYLFNKFAFLANGGLRQRARLTHTIKNQT